MRKLNAGFFAFFFAAAAIARSEWQIVSTDNETSTAPAVEHHALDLRESDSGNRTTIHFALFPSRTATVRVIDNVSGGDLAAAMERDKCLAGVNGGYFDPQFNPIGLRVIDGTVTRQLTRARLLTGVLCASRRGMEIVRLSEFSCRRKLDAAIECGPFLIDSGARVRSLDQIRSARRSFAAVARGGDAALGVSSELTLAQLADALSNLAGDFKIWRAINLDGGSSSAFWFRRAAGTALFIPEEKSVRDFVAVVAR